MIVQPIEEQRQQQVRDVTLACVARAGELYRRSFDAIPVYFDLRGRAAGMYRVQGGQRFIRYNPYLFAKYFDDSLATTVPHEVAHYVTDILFGLHNIRPHGAEWKSVMRSLGASPRIRGDYDLSDVPVRRQKRYHYRCACCTHQLSACRHNRVRRGQAAYVCRLCGTRIVSVTDEP